MKLAADDDNANLILIWPRRHFQQKKVEVPFAKNTGIKVLKMRYWYAVIKFVCGSSIGTCSPEKCVTDILPSNLFVVYRFEYRYF